MSPNVEDCTVAVAVLSDVPHKFTPEIAPASSGRTATVFKHIVELSGLDFVKCLRYDGSGLGWVELGKCS